MTNSREVRWRKSSRSDDKGECVEVAALGGGAFGIRDSKDPGGQALVVGRDAFRRLLSRARATGSESARDH